MHNPNPNFEGGYNPNLSFRCGYNPNPGFTLNPDPNPPLTMRFVGRMLDFSYNEFLTLSSEFYVTWS